MRACLGHDIGSLLGLGRLPQINSAILQINYLAQRTAEPFPALGFIDETAGNGNTQLIRIADAVGAAEAVFLKQLGITEVEKTRIENRQIALIAIGYT